MGGEHIYVLYFDFSKALETVSHFQNEGKKI